MIQFEKQKHAALITFNRANRLKVINSETIAERETCLNDAEHDDDDVQVLIITSESVHFCKQEESFEAPYAVARR